MDRKLAEVLCQIMSDEGEDARIYEKYSGRHMHGKHTTGIVVDNVIMLTTRIIAHADQLVDENGEPLFAEISDLRQDNLGTQMILY